MESKKEVTIGRWTTTINATSQTWGPNQCKILQRLVIAASGDWMCDATITIPGGMGESGLLTNLVFYTVWVPDNTSQGNLILMALNTTAVPYTLESTLRILYEMRQYDEAIGPFDSPDLISIEGLPS